MQIHEILESRKVSTRVYSALGLLAHIHKHKRIRSSKPTPCKDACSIWTQAGESDEQTAWHVCMAKGALAPLPAQSDDHADSSVMLAVLCTQTNKQVKSHNYQNVHVVLGTWGGGGT